MTASPTVEELLTESAAVARIPGRDADVRAWLRGLGIARRGPTGVRLYLWSEVCAALPREHEATPRRHAPPVTLRRSSRV